ncbi:MULTISPECIES: PRC-barrel domain containing protein [Haloprofundus]|uniref:PRC-barrel domain containing protein n=1 Tax=Haloprofundus TaxID=1911573 RepID=UPI000E43F404|nr:MULTISPECIES: PRC-barrel domain containing protein [Haloprofundus]QCJ46916.1 PRC-barrel domain containing protein [Haloprofundus sp. MHR1]
MSRNFRGEDRGKRVVDHEGNEVGTIELVDDNDEYANVERGGSITEGIMEMLGWESDGDSRLHREHVMEMNDEEVRLKEPQERRE